jgi:hypothetical protein
LLYHCFFFFYLFIDALSPLLAANVRRVCEVAAQLNHNSDCDRRLSKAPPFEQTLQPPFRKTVCYLLGFPQFANAADAMEVRKN